MQTENVQNPPKFNWEEKSRDIVKFKDQREIIGLFTGTRSRDVTEVNEETGERLPKTITDLCLTTPEKQRIAVAMDTGLRIALSSADIDLEKSSGKIWLKMVRGEQKSIGGAKKVNTYKVFQMPANAH